MKYLLVFTFLMFSSTFTSYSQKNYNLEHPPFNEMGEYGRLMIKGLALFDKKTDSSTYYYKEAYKLAKQSKKDSLIIITGYKIFYNLFHKGNYEEAKPYCQEVSTISKKRGVKFFNVLSQIGLGALYAETGFHDLALNEYLEAEKLLDSSDSYRLALIYNNIALLSTKNEQGSKLGHDYFMKAIAIHKNRLSKPELLNYYEKREHATLLILSYNNLANIYNTYEKKLECYENSLNILNQYSDILENPNFRHITILRGIAAINMEFNKPNEAGLYFKKALNMANEIGYLDEVININSDLAKLYLKQRENKLAQKHIDIIFKNEHQKITFGHKRIDSLAFEVYYINNEHNKAAIHAKKYFVELDSILKAQKENAFIEFSKKYESDKKEKENILLQKDIQLKQSELEEERIRNIILAVGLTLFILTSFIIWRYYLKNKKLSKDLSENLNIVSLKNTELQELNDVKEKLFRVIAHDLMNPFHASLRYVEILKNDFDNLNSNEKNEVIDTVYDSTFQNYELTKKLLDWFNSHKNEYIINKQLINVDEVICESLKNYQFFASKKNIAINVKIEDNIMLHTDKNLFSVIVENVISNALKFSKENGNIWINSFVNKNQVFVEIKDNGVGFDSEKINPSSSKMQTSYGTKGERGTGFGLKIIKEFTTALNGSIIISSQQGTGTTVTLCL